MTDAFLAARQQRGFIACLDDNDAVGIEPGLSEGRREEIRAGDAPQYLAGSARGDPGGKENGGGAVERAGGAAGDFVQRGQGEPGPREGAIHGRKAKRKRCRVGALGAHAADVVPKLAQQRFVPDVSLPRSS
jgi:hypothetical protein